MVPYYPVVVPAPYISHPGGLVTSPCNTNQESDVENENVTNNNSTKNVDSNMENNEMIEKNDNAKDKKVEIQDQNLNYLEQQNAGYVVMPWFPGQLVWPVYGYGCIPQPEKIETEKTQSPKNAETTEAVNNEKSKNAENEEIVKTVNSENTADENQL